MNVAEKEEVSYNRLCKNDGKGESFPDMTRK